ncbi:MurR/RpiR family transcriptional regulator [Diplocloster hominis]|uniref:MurR/RpiR family transcriptional regulator n=1 Tax=Diplocloster hominis TaxID=3079010 RepID=UPI0031BA3C96
MAQGDFMMQVRSNYNQFTKAERKVADYLLQHAQDVLFMSITDLADACKVGETTVFRFCKTMKLQGYQEFKIKVSLSIKGEEEAQPLLEDVNKDDNLMVLTQKLLNSNVNAVVETNALLDHQKLLQVLRAMVPARKIMFFGVGSSGHVAMMATNKFLRITDKVFCYTDSHMQAMAASLLGQQDVAVVISYSGSTKDSILTAKLAKEAGAYVVGITRFAKSPLTTYSDTSILCGAKEGPLQGGSTTAVMSQLYIMEVLYTEYYRQTYNESYINNKKSAESIVDKMY